MELKDKSNVDEDEASSLNISENDKKSFANDLVSSPGSLSVSEKEALEGDDGQREFVGPIRNTRRRSMEQSGPMNPEAARCTRFSDRRNALCDPFRLLIPQTKREELEQKVEKRKTSVTRKVSNFLTVNLDLNREEELI